MVSRYLLRTQLLGLFAEIKISPKMIAATISQPIGSLPAPRES
jgi:hypothetical protein